MKTLSRINGKEYEPEKCVHVVNTLQAFMYINNNAELLDVIPGENKKIVFVFDREKTYILYDLWCKRELL